MLTPQEVSEHAFAKASFGGYNMAMVDEFLDRLTEDYTTLYKENQVLKSKMKVLVEKVEEYRATDDSMRRAFLVAQKSAEDIVAKAEAERGEMIRQAETEARARVEEFRKDLETEQQRLAEAQAATAAYINKVRQLCQNELTYLDALSPAATIATNTVEQAAPEVEVAPQWQPEVEAPQEELITQPEELFDQDDEEEIAVESDGGLYAEILELGLNRRSEEEHRPRRLSADEPDEIDEPTRRFDNLQFGRDYEIR